MTNPPPPPPPPPPPNFNRIPLPTSTTLSEPNPQPKPTLPIPSNPPAPNARLVFLLIYNGWPFADHWEFFVSSPSSSSFSSPSEPSTDTSTDTDTGVVITASGNVRTGFWLEIKRGWDLRGEGNKPDGKVPLGWVGEEYFREGCDDEKGPVCEFERALFRVPAPEKTLRSVEGDDGGVVGKRARIRQRNCQTWVVEAAEQLVKEGIFEQRVADFLHSLWR